MTPRNLRQLPHSLVIFTRDRSECQKSKLETLLGAGPCAHHVVAYQPLGDPGFCYWHFPANQAVSERGGDLSKVAWLRIVIVRMGKRRGTCPSKYLKNVSSP